MKYFSFVKANRRFLAFGLLMALFSGFGQTYFIALFSAELRTVFGLTHGGFGSIYAAATLASGLCVIWLGRKIDQVDLRLYAVLVCVGLILGCFLMSVVPSVALLYLSIFAMRLTGQGLMSHTAVTSMVRYFEGERGKAVSIAALGFPVGAAVFPLIGVALNRTLGWRGTWSAIGVVLAVTLIPLILWLLKGHGERHRRLLKRASGAGTAAGLLIRQWTRREVFRDSRFYLILPSVVAPSFIMTGFFFHQVHLVEAKAWSMTWFAACYVAFSAATIATSLLSGPLIDRVGAWRLMPFVCPPLGVALWILAAADSPIVALLFLTASGVTSGANFAIVGAVWAELYGVAHVGAIRASVAALMVFASALSPGSMGRLIDGGVTMETISVLCLVYVVVATALVWVAGRRRPNPASVEVGGE